MTSSIKLYLNHFFFHISVKDLPVTLTCALLSFITLPIVHDSVSVVFRRHASFFRKGDKFSKSSNLEE
jgi:hypothetical protein